MLADINAALTASGKTGKLVFGGTTPDISGGVLLSDEKIDIDCSFESLIALFRESREMDVANILFRNEV